MVRRRRARRGGRSRQRGRPGYSYNGGNRDFTSASTLPQPKPAGPDRKRNVDVVRPRARPGHDQLARHPLRSRRRRARASRRPEFRQIFPQPGWVEHDATEIWATQSGVMHEALAKAGIGARDVAAIGITNQRETTVVWDRATGTADRQRHRLAGPAHGADVRRAARRRPRRDVRAQDRARARRLLLRHQAQLAARPRRRRARARGERGELAFGTIDAWLVWNLTARRACT